MEFIKNIEMTKSKKLLYAIVKELSIIDDKVKLAKLAYFADFIHYAFYNKPISEENNLYQKRPFGPLSITFNSDLNSMLEEGLLVSDKQYHYKVKKDMELDLDKNETKTLKYVLDKYAKYPYNILVDIAHKQIPYISANEGGIIDFNTAYNLVDEYPDYLK
jgi:uncharacterized phage-associated protein